jgi:NifB/MoaA-like Fe-S oxidoreductase
MKFESEKDDRVINETLQQLQSQGAKIEDITVRLVPVGVTLTALYVIKYEAPSAL